MGSVLNLAVERLNGGQPILGPTDNAWENWTVCNASAIHLPANEANRTLITGLIPGCDAGSPALRDGIIVVHYRACPKQWTDFPPSHIGLAVFTPRLELLYRHPEPVLRSGLDPRGLDFTSVEDPRVTRVGDTFYMLYCGYTVFQDGTGRMSPCRARSTDLIHWEKLGAFDGEVREPNKDHVLFSEPIDGYHFMLHRPCLLKQSDFAIQLAMSDHPDGWWKNLGVLFAADPMDGYEDCWNGAGTVPIHLGGQRYLHIYHTGRRTPAQDRVYTIDACLLDFTRFDPRHPERIVTARLEHVLEPETEFETNSPADAAHRLDCLFPCGSYTHGEDLVIIYGGADAYVLACRVNLSDLLQALESRTK